MPQPPTFHVGASESEDGGDDMDTLVDDLLLDDEDINKTIVVGIDFGTTYSGVSWAVDYGKRPKTCMITTWPNFGCGINNANSVKVPTLISYDTKDSRGSISWGFHAKDPVHRWFKIMLDPDHEHAKRLNAVSDTELTEASIQMARTATVDYLNKLWCYSRDNIRRHKPDDKSNKYSFRVFLTVPAMWKQEARENTRSLAIDAGIPGPIEIVSEPEAAVLAAFHEMAGHGYNFKRDDIVVVCDAGGGTVDLITYRIKNPRPLRVEEFIRGTGGLCGAAFIDEAFENMVKCKVGDEYFQIKLEYREKMIRDFGVGIKRSFDFDPSDKERGKNIKFSVELRGVKDNTDEDIQGERIFFDSETLRTIFDGVCERVVALVESQVKAAEAKMEELEMKTQTLRVLLVGGFGMNEYLQYRVRSAMANRPRSEIRPGLSVSVATIASAWSSVAEGATLWGLEQLNPERLKSKASSSEAGDRTTTRVTGRYPPSSFGIMLDTGDMIWLAEARTPYPEGSRPSETIVKDCGKVSFFGVIFNTSKIITHTLWSCDTGTEEPPSRFNPQTMKKLCELSHKVKSQKLFQIRDKKLEYDIGIELCSASVKFFVFSKDRKFTDVCEAQYYISHTKH